MHSPTLFALVWAVLVPCVSPLVVAAAVWWWSPYRLFTGSRAPRRIGFGVAALVVSVATTFANIGFGLWKWGSRFGDVGSLVAILLPGALATIATVCSLEWAERRSQPPAEARE